MHDLPNPIDIGRSLALTGPIFQLAWVPKDVTATLRFWIETMGVGPFHVLDQIPMVDTFYNDKPTKIVISAYLGYWGDLQIELIEQHNPEETIYTTWREKENGLHHVACMASDFEAAGELLALQGGTLAQRGTVVNSCHYQYWDMGRAGPYIEIGTATPQFIEFNTRLKQASINWDGSDPLRVVHGDEYVGLGSFA